MTLDPFATIKADLDRLMARARLEGVQATVDEPAVLLGAREFLAVWDAYRDAMPCDLLHRGPCPRCQVDASARRLREALGELAMKVTR